MSLDDIRSVSKKTLSMYLRTKCDKELYLSLHKQNSMVEEGLPEPVKRPAIGLLSVAGQEFEVERNDQLVRLFPPGTIKYSRGESRFGDMNLVDELNRLASDHAVILQGRFSIADIQESVLGNIGLVAADVSVVPPIAEFIPDIVVVRPAKGNDVEVRSDGSREPIVIGEDMRQALQIIDVKHTSEANPSYCAEIALYALMLSNLISHNESLAQKYFVSLDACLWTRFRQENSALVELEDSAERGAEAILNALFEDTEEANLRFYLSSVRNFYEDVVRVIRKCSESQEAWRELEWHVNSTCSVCDWLGDSRHISVAQREIVTANEESYCLPEAANSGHLCLVPGITKGAKKVLQLNGLPDARSLSGAHDHPAFQDHTVLKKEAKHLPARTSAILSGVLDNDDEALIASLVKSANVLVYASVNFDASSGLLTGLSLSGVATGFVPGQAPTRFPPTPYIVDEKTLDAEWVALNAFLTQIAHYIETAESLAGNPSGQIHFWEERQFKELCDAIGRHLPKVLALTNRKAKAMTWIFPPEEILATPNSLQASTVVIVEDIVKRMVFAPTPHVITLFDTAEHYNNGYVHTVRDSYYREYLNNGIPRERIYEVWSGRPQVKRGSTLLPRNNLIIEYSGALSKQPKALEAICEKLREDYSSHFRARATKIPISIPQGARNVAFDGKLWIWWDQLDFNASHLEGHIRLSLDGERLEATYEAIVLDNGVSMGNGVFEFDVAQGSLESKFKEDSRLTLGKLGMPGMPLERVSNIIDSSAPPFLGNENALFSPLWSALDVSLISFNRDSAKAIIQFSGWPDDQLVNYLFTYSKIDLLNDVFLLENQSPKPFDWSRNSTQILMEIGNPSIAIADNNAADAMGMGVRARRGGRDAITPAARVLWDAGNLQAESVETELMANSISNYVTERNRLNLSQKAAVAHAIEKALTLIWGPPGTGKTNTLSSVIHGAVQFASSSQTGLKVLVTGPTYKAVEEIMTRTAELISTDSSASCSMFMSYTQGRSHGEVPANINANVTYTALTFNNTDTEYENLLQGLRDGDTIMVVGCSVRQARRFTKDLSGDLIHPLFDFVFLDESSQIPVSQAISAFTGLKNNSRLVIAGDTLQMPPIVSIEPPVGSEYLVGSIQNYLIKRVFNPRVQECVLEVNYRSNEDIVSFARSIGYPGTLEANRSARALNFINSLPAQDEYPSGLPWVGEYPQVLAPTTPVVTLLHDDEVASQGNMYEAKIVAGMVWLLRQSVSAELHDGVDVEFTIPSAEQFWKNCIGVVTPHRAQRALVMKELSFLFPTEINLINDAVDTVERFQGGERHTIIVTFGVGDTDVISGEEAFLMQLERTNVAISRAMAKCIVIMPKTLATHIPEDKKALASAHAIKDYVEEFCNIRVDTEIELDGNVIAAQLRYHC